MSKSRTMQRAAARRKIQEPLTIGERFYNWICKKFKKGDNHEKS